MEKPSASKNGQRLAPVLAQESVTLVTFPKLTELLLDPYWNDGSEKGKRCLMLFIDDSSCRLLVKMEGDGLKSSVPAHGLDEALATFERLLVEGKVIWEQDEAHVGRRAKKKK